MARDTGSLGGLHITWLIADHQAAAQVRVPSRLQVQQHARERFAPGMRLPVGLDRRVCRATLPLLRNRGLSALPVTYIGKAATFSLMCGFPLVLLGSWHALWSRIVGDFGWGFLFWGLFMYLWAFALYAVQMVLVMRLMPKTKPKTKPKTDRSGNEPVDKKAAEHG